MSFLNKIFGKKDEPDYPALTDFSSFVTDIHSHLIPGIDDGSKTMDESLELIRGFRDLGFKKLVTTPHIMSDAFRNTPEIILDGLEKLRTAVKAAGIEIELDASAEYYFDEAFSKLVDDNKILPLREKYILFEISYINAPDLIHQMVFQIQMKGYTPILAHPERYPYWYKRFEEYHKIKEAGALFQINTNSIAGYYGPDARRIAERMINENMVDFIGSDMHGSRHMESLKRCLGEKSLWKLAAQGVRNSTLWP